MMSFLNGRVSPEPLCLNAVVETELTDSFSHDKGTDFIHDNNNEGMGTSITDYRYVKECQESPQEGLDDIPEEHIHFTSDQSQQEKLSRPGSQCPKRLSWNIVDASPNHQKWYHSCDRVVLLTLCVMSTASVVLTLLMLFGIVGPLNCSCSGKTGSGTSVPNADHTEFSKNVQDLKQNVSSLKESYVRPELEEMRKKYDEMRKKYKEMKTEITELKGKKLSAESNKSESYSDKDNITALWQAIQTNRQEIIQLDRKDNISALWQAIQTNKQEITQLDQKARHSNVASLQRLINSSRQDMMNELTRIWTSVNSTSKDLQENVKASWLAVLNAINNTKMELQQKINNISKMAGPIGPPGFNGSQGPAGPAGSIGAPGPKGAGNFSACKYHEEIATTSGGDSDAYVDEPSGSIIMAATCSTNYALECNLSTVVMPGTNKRRYICNCKGASLNFLGNSKRCFLHYWLCPIS